MDVEPVVETPIPEPEATEPEATTPEAPKEPTEADVREQAMKDMPPGQVVLVKAAIDGGARLHAIPLFESVLGDEKRWYAYRTIKRREWHKIQFEHRQRLQGAKEELTQSEAESMFEDAVVALCSVAPKISFETIGAYDAGAISTLADAIMFSSGFNQNSVPVRL